MIEAQFLNEILAGAPAFLLIAVRALAMIETAPLLSSDGIPQIAKIALAGFAAFTAFPTALAAGWNLAPFGLYFVFLLIGEAIVGIIIGFYLTLIFSAFSTAGQFFSLQMGFGASETFDPLSQIENPLMGQYLNLVAMLVFLSIGGFSELFLGGFWRSIQSISAYSLVMGREAVVETLLTGLTKVFMDAIVISMPILGTLFLTSLSTGLISKAAPQINILTEGFPISITVAFVLIMATMPFMTEAFARVVDMGFQNIESLYIRIGTQLGEPLGGGL
ncbi:flagellar biosynthetic protein FliR [Treponema primitia]|uniref:flagellar biosynthetic protein FliR n=1 Tax=Treponema primitia TaxID=88058 RepID=UPI00025558FF|nr:flagellar biosynthetic protein FliR [Treponema primitia]